MIRRPLALALFIVCVTFGAAAGDSIDSISINYASSTLWSHIERVCIQGDYAYCAAAHGLMIYDISNITDPELISTSFLEYGVGKDIAVSGNYAYLCCNTDGVKVFDISDPHNPIIVGQYVEDYWRADEIIMSGSSLYILNSFDGVYILDITVPTTPVFVGEYDGIGGIKDVIPRGDYLYCGSSFGLEILNISDPSTPDSVGCLANDGGARAAVISDTLAYLMSSSTIYIACISDPANPYMIDSLALGFSSYAVRDMFIIDGYLYTSHGEYDEGDDDGGMLVYDLADPLNPTVACHLKMDAWRISNLGDKIGITDLQAYYKIMDLVDPENPAEAGEFDIPHTRSWGFRGIETNGRYAYLAFGPSDLYVVDISDPTNMIPIEGDFLSGGAFELELSRGWLFVASGSYGNEGLYIFDTYNPYNPGLPIEVGYYPYNSPQEITLANGYAFMAGNSGTSIILDMRLPFEPSLVSDYRAGGITWGIAVEGDYAYLANMLGLIIVDISDIDEPVVADTIAEPFEALYDAIIYKGYLVTGGNYAFKVRDISNPLSPVTVAQIDFSSDVNGLKPYGNYIMAAVATDGLVIFDMTTPASPSVIGTQSISGEAQDVVFYGGHAFVVDQYGLMSFRVDLPSCCILGGDVGFDGHLGMGDVVLLINNIFKDGAPVNCSESADINNDCSVDIGDAVFLINHLLRDGPVPICSDCIK
jgi:hypothetical protein